MGKVSKRSKQGAVNGSRKQRQNVDSSESKTAAKYPQQEIESADNLQFEDPFVDEFEVEEEYNGEEPMEVDETKSVPVRPWNPLTCEPLEPGTTLEMDETAYKMHHSLTPEWPSLSFSIIRDNLGDNRTRFPHTVIAAVGSQAERADQNKITIMKLSDLSRTGPKNKTTKDLEDEMMGAEYDAESDPEEEHDDDEDDDEDDVDMEPVLEHYSLQHHGGVNRLRSMPQHPEIIASWSDTGVVNLFDISGVLQNLERPSTTGASSTGKINQATKIRKAPFFVYQGHEIEGYAMDWSKVTPGLFATGDCHGFIHIWQPAGSSVVDKSWSTSSFSVTKAYGPVASNKKNVSSSSIEDIQWSPTEPTVFATGECSGFIRIYDIRCQGRPMISNQVHDNGSDVNVISWNSMVSNLLASGGHDGKNIDPIIPYTSSMPRLIS
jgi:ribosome assembly protein RRB1